MVELRQRIQPIRSASHRAWVRRKLCLISPCGGREIIAHHIRVRTDGGMGMKPSDIWVVPLCYKHHCEIHMSGSDTFEAKYEVDLRATAERLAAYSPYLK